MGAGPQTSHLILLSGHPIDRAQASKGNAGMVAAAAGSILAQSELKHAHEQSEVIATRLARQAPQVEAMMCGAKEDLLASTGFPRAHWR